jgi:hypothetical protein
MLCAALATVMLEALLVGGERASINTMLPGWTYASATVMKICLVAGVVAAVVALVSVARSRWFPVSASNSGAGSPSWGILSVALLPLSPLIGAFAVVIAQALVDTQEGPSMSYLSFLSRCGVLMMLVWISTSMMLGVVALLKRERPRSLSVFSLVMSACLIGLFWYFQFYKLGFDQDRWAARARVGRERGVRLV